MWFKYDRDYLCVNKSHFVQVIFEPPCNNNNNNNVRYNPVYNIENMTSCQLLLINEYSLKMAFL